MALQAGRIRFVPSRFNSESFASRRLNESPAFAQGYGEAQLPSPSTMAEVLNRLGFRLRKVVKAKPQKKIAETDAIFANIEKKTRRQRPRQPSNA